MSGDDRWGTPPSDGWGGELPPPPRGGEQGGPGWPGGGEQRGFGGGGAFGDGAFGGAPTPARNGVALASMICGLVAIACIMLFFLLITVPLAVLTGLAAVVTGVIGLRRSRREGLGGRGQAITGIVTGLVAVGLVAGLVAVSVFAIQQFDFETNPFADPEGFVEELEQRGVEVDEDGRIDPEGFEQLIEDEAGQP